MDLPGWERSLTIFSRLNTTHERDGQADRQTDRRTDGRTSADSKDRGKMVNFFRTENKRPQCKSQRHKMLKRKIRVKMDRLVRCYFWRNRNLARRNVSCDSDCLANTYSAGVAFHSSFTTTTTTTKTFITRKFAEAANARSVDSTEEKRLQSLFEDVQRDVRWSQVDRKTVPHSRTVDGETPVTITRSGAWNVQQMKTGGS